MALMGAKLHRLLIDLTTGDANAVVRRSRNANGLLAWKRLSASLNPKTLASGLKCINAAHNPPRILDVRQIDIQVEEWQSKLEKLAAEYGETISSRVKLAILYRMMPREVQEKLLDKCRVQWSTVKDDDVTRTVVAVLEEVKELAKSHREQLVPIPMDISHVVKLLSTHSLR